MTTWSGMALVLLGGAALVPAVDGRWRAAALGLLRLGVFALLLAVWPATLAAVPLASGWLSAALLGLAAREQETVPVAGAERMMRLAALGLAWLAAFSLAQGAVAWIPGLTPAAAFAGLAAVAAGLVLVGLEQGVLALCAGVLAVWGGFLLFYAVVERALLVVGALALLEIGLAWVGGTVLTWEVVE